MHAFIKMIDVVHFLNLRIELNIDNREPDFALAVMGSLI